MAVPNQKNITIKKVPHTDPTELCVKIADMQEAAATLSGVGFKIWLWFCTAPTGENFDLLPSMVTDSMNISLASYKNGIKELIEKGYLVTHPHKRKPNAYIFRDSLSRQIE